MGKPNTQCSIDQRSPVANLPYHRHIRFLHTHFPHLESLSLYSHECERARIAGQLGSDDSDSILAAEVSRSGDIVLHRINCYDHNDLERYHDILTGTGESSDVLARIIVIEDLSPAAIEILGAGFQLDPHVFYFHIGFDTRCSAMMDLIDPKNESSIPVTWCMPSHAPENFISVPLPRDLMPSNARGHQRDLPVAKTYSRQAYRPITDFRVPQENWDPPQRAFHRLSLVFPPTKIETTIVLAFPTWKRVSQSPHGKALDSFGFSFDSPATRLGLTSLQKHHAEYAREFQKAGTWNDGQWQRTMPLFNALISPSLDVKPGRIRERSLLWLYSKLNDNYFLACQNEGRCWRDLREVLDKGCLEDRTSQQPKRKFRDSMTKTIELLKISEWLNSELDSADDQEAYQKLRQKVGMIICYEEARLSQVLLNISDEQSEVQMQLLVQHLADSRHAISQLTKLAFIFVPLATVFSAFSMNIKEMHAGPPTWLLVVVVIFCTMVPMAVSSKGSDGCIAEQSCVSEIAFVLATMEGPSWLKYKAKGIIYQAEWMPDNRLYRWDVSEKLCKSHSN